MSGEPEGKYIAAGLATAPTELVRMGAYALNPLRVYRALTGQATEADRAGTGWSAIPSALERVADRWNTQVSDTLGIEENPSLQDDTGNALLKLAGQSFPVPTRALGRLAAAAPPLVRSALESLPGRAVTKTAELLTPTTSVRTLAPKEVIPKAAANVGAQAVVGAGVERAIEEYDPTKPYVKYDADGNVTKAYFPADDTRPGVGRVAVDSVRDVVGEHPYLSALGGLALGAGAIATRRSLRTAERIRADQATSTIMEPLDRTPDAPPIGGPVKQAANAFAETVQDSNIQAKEAVRQQLGANPRTMAPDDPVMQKYNEVRDALDLINEAPHKDRSETLFQTGRLNTPGGEVKTEALKRIAEDVARASARRPELSTNVKELIAAQTELDNRRYAVLNGADKVEIDVRTGDLITPSTPAQYRAKVTPRATLHASSDHKLQSIVRHVEATDPEAVAYAERYWKLHKDLADSWVKFGIIDATERAKWGRANPHFMHTINLDTPKSPRTYRYREHMSGPAMAGDPFLAAAQYQDYMLSHVYKNRARQKVVEALRSGGGGPRGNSPWLGKIAHPKELAQQTIVDVVTGVRRPMTKLDLKLTGDTISYYDGGHLVEVEVPHPALLSTLKISPSHAQSTMGYIRQISQSAMTGKIATLLGQPFALANATMGALFANVVRPAGRSFGAIDRAVQKASGGKIGFRGDPTAYPGMVGAAAKDVHAIMQRTLSEVLYNSINAGGMAAKVADAVTKRGAQGIAFRAAQRYTNSVYAERHTTGGASASTLGDRDFDTAGGKATTLGGAPYADQARVKSDPVNYAEQIKQYKDSVTPAGAKVALRAIGDIQEAISNMASSYLYHTNRGKQVAMKAQAKSVETVFHGHMDAAVRAEDQAARFKQLAKTAQYVPQQQSYLARAAQEDARALAARAQAARLKPQMDKLFNDWFNEVNNLGMASRQLLGDTAMMGTGLRTMGKSERTLGQKVVGGVLEAVPYGNIGVQAGARLIRAAKENPYGTGAALMMTLGPIVMLRMAFANAYDNALREKGEAPQAVPYDLQRPDWHKSRFINLYIPGMPVDQPISIRVDPLLSFIFTGMDEGMQYLAGWTNENPDEPLRNVVNERLSETIRARSMSNILSGALNMQPINQLPPWLGGILAAGGAEGTSLDKLISRGGVRMIPQQGMGGYDDTRYTDDIIHRRTEAAINAVLGGPVMSWVEAIRQGYQASLREGGSFIGRTAQTAVGKAQDRQELFSPLFEHPQKRATTDFIGERINAVESAAERIVQNAASYKAEGTIGGGKSRQADDIGGGRGGVKEGMEPILDATARMAQQMAKQKETRTLLRNEMDSIQQRGLTFTERRLEENRVADNIRRLNADMLNRWQEFERRVSEDYGIRFRVTELDPRKGFEQFEHTD